MVSAAKAVLDNIVAVAKRMAKNENLRFLVILTMIVPFDNEIIKNLNGRSTAEILFVKVSRETGNLQK